MILFGPGVVFFTVHYLMLRGFYALEQTRTVFFVQCVIAAVNIVAAILLAAGAAIWLSGAFQAGAPPVAGQCVGPAQRRHHPGRRSRRASPWRRSFPDAGAVVPVTV